MIERLVGFALAQRLMVCVAGMALLFGGLYAFHILDVVAYPDPSPPMIEVITQYPGWSDSAGHSVDIGAPGAMGTTNRVISHVYGRYNSF